jgi:hypothetical protein
MGGRVDRAGVGGGHRSRVEPDLGDELGGGAADADHERAELGVAGRGLVVAHRVDDVLEVGEVVGEQGHAPLPVVEPGRARDELQHPAGVGPAAAAVLVHQPAALLEVERVPVVVTLAAVRHRVEAGELPRGHPRVELVLVVLRHPLGELLDAAVEVLARDALAGEVLAVLVVGLGVLALLGQLQVGPVEGDRRRGLGRQHLGLQGTQDREVLVERHQHDVGLVSRSC